MKKLILISILYMLLIPLIMAIPPVQTSSNTESLHIAYPQYQYIPINSNFTLHIHVYNASQYIKGATANCYLDIYNPAGIETASNQMTEGTSDYYTNITNNFTTLGVYSFIIQCNTTGQSGFANGVFEVNPLGKTLSESRAILYIGFLGLLILIFFLNFYGMSFLPARNQKDEDGKIMSISYLKYFRNVLWMTGYFLFIGINFIASNLAFAFLEEELVAKTLFMIFRVSFGLAPIVIVVWVIWIFASMFHDKEFQRMLNRGIFPQGKL